MTDEFFFFSFFRSVDSFINCLQNIVHKRCSSDETAFKIISYALYQSVLPKCFPYSNSNKASKTNLFDQTYTDSAGSNTRNKSEKVVVYQHVEDRHSNGSMLLTNFFYLFCAISSFLHFWLHDCVFFS